jgi:hypothetical protein
VQVDGWLNPDYAVQQFALLGAALLASLLILPVILGALVYGLLTLAAKLIRRPGDYTHTDGGI